jgi:hypothetical protein
MRNNKEPEEGSREAFRNVMCMRRTSGNEQCASKSFCAVTLPASASAIVGVGIALAEGLRDIGQTFVLTGIYHPTCPNYGAPRASYLQI